MKYCNNDVTVRVVQPLLFMYREWTTQRINEFLGQSFRITRDHICKSQITG